jgi:hypothetical protein
MDDSSAHKATEHSLRSLLRLSEKLNSAPDLDSLLDSLVEQLLDLTGSESGCAGLRTSQGMSCSHFFQGPRVVPLAYHCAPGVGWAGWLLAHGTHYLTNDAAHDPVIVPEVRERLGVKSGIAVTRSAPAQSPSGRRMAPVRHVAPSTIRRHADMAWRLRLCRRQTHKPKFPTYSALRRDKA